mmetsp:Transcript_25493/g.82512  ORF Transcript_25493/g.82512 Transcript_25493/m.82512 type:complete len:126 (-) Transcript_25493:2598-2975(-)
MRAYRRLSGPEGERRRASLRRVSGALRAALAGVADNHPDVHVIPSASAIHALVVPGARRVVAVADSVRRDGYDVRPIRAPTVKPGSERLRIVAHAHNSIDDARNCANAIDRALTRDDNTRGLQGT